MRYIQELHSVLHIPIKDIHNDRLYIDRILNKPAQLKIEDPYSERVRAAANDGVIEVEATMKPVNDDLRQLRLHQEDLEGE